MFTSQSALHLISLWKKFVYERFPRDTSQCSNNYQLKGFSKWRLNCNWESCYTLIAAIFLIQIIFIISDISEKEAFATSYSTAMKFYVALLKFLMLTNESTSQCVTEERITAVALKGHTFKTFVVTPPYLCYFKCDQYPRCRSFNYVIQEKVCELNNRTKEETSEYFVRDPERFYTKNWAETGIGFW